MEQLLKMNRRLRITTLLSGFYLFFVIFFLTGNRFFILFSFLFLGLLIASNILYSKKYSNVMENSLEKELKKNEFKYDKSYLSDEYLTGIATNEESQKIAIMTRDSIKDKFSFRTYNFKDIIETSVLENGVTITKSSKSSLIGGAIAGSVLAGTTGAIIGGLSGNKIAEESISKISLIIVVDNLTTSVHRINFLNSNMPLKRSDELYQTVYDETLKWHKTLSVIIKRNELNSQSV